MAPAGNYRPDIVDLLTQQFKSYPEVAPKRIFGHPGFSLRGRIFCFVYEDGLALKLPLQDYEDALKLEEVEKFQPGRSPMGTWIVLIYPEAEDYLNNWNWIEKAMEYIVTDQAAPPKKKKSPRK